MPRSRSRWWPVALLLAATAGLAAFAQQPPAEPPPRTTIPFEEEEPNAPKPPYKRIELDDDLPDLAVTSGAYYARLNDVLRGAAAAKNPAVKEFLSGFTVAFDRVTEVAPRNKPRPQYRVTPVPLLWGDGGVVFPDEFGVVPLDDGNRTGEVKTLARGQVFRIESFERIALAAVNRFLNSTPSEKDVPKPDDKLAAAERVLSDVLLFHDRARELNRRKGVVWNPVKAEVNEKLTEIRVARIRQAVQDKDWATVRSLGGRLADRYRNQPKVLEVVYTARLAEAEEGLRSDRVADLERVKVLLNEYDARFPNSADETAGRLRKVVADRASKLLGDAARFAVQNPTEARNILRTVESLDPDHPGLRKQQQELKSGYAVLLVGTRRLPERMSPGTARWDSEKQAVELMFEGLTEAVSDEALGVRYWPVLAADRPLIGAGVRDLSLVGSAEWAGPDRGLLDVGDLTGTVDLLRARPGTWEADPVGWIKDVAPAPGEPGRVRIRFDRGHPDPRSLLTFKLLPARWLASKGKQADDSEFARRPFGTGPFRLAPTYRPPVPGDPGSGQVAFVSNPAYGRRPGRMGQPAIKEVRFVDVTRGEHPSELFKGEVPRLHVLTDVPTAELPMYDGPGLVGRVQVAKADASRRIHILAVNHRRPTLQSANLRRGLMHAVDRDAILNDVFRAGQPKFHRALTGPFPPTTWAAARPNGVDPPALYNRDLAAAKLRAYRDAGGPSTVRLAFTADDPLAKAACERIRADVEAAGGGAGGTGVSLELEPLTPADLYRQTQDEHRFDLAYLPFDYRNDWYPVELARFLDPSAAGRGGRNYLGFFAPGSEVGKEGDELSRVLDDVRLYRDPGKLVSRSHDIQKLFNDVVPFVPLWHLDRHLVISTAVKVYLDGRPEEASPRMLDPTTLFDSVGRWRIE